VKALKTFLVISAMTIVAVAVPTALGGNLSAAQLQALEIQGQARNQLCQTSTLAREGYVALCGRSGSQHQPTRAELRALQIRGEALDALYAKSQASSSRSFRSAPARVKLPPPFKPIQFSPIGVPPTVSYTGNTKVRMLKACVGWKCSAAS